MTTDKEKLLAFADSLEWQPIETAPKDGVRILLYQPEGDNGSFRSAIGYTSWRQKTCTGFYDKPFWYEFQAGDGYEYQEEKVKPTHWMPLPTGEAAAVIRQLVKYATTKASEGSLESEIALEKAAEQISKS